MSKAKEKVDQMTAEIQSLKSREKTLRAESEVNNVRSSLQFSLAEALRDRYMAIYELLAATTALEQRRQELYICQEVVRKVIRENPKIQGSDQIIAALNLNGNSDLPLIEDQGPRGRNTGLTEWQGKKLATLLNRLAVQ